MNYNRMESETTEVRKNTGELVHFREEKLKAALRRSGADEQQIEKVTAKVIASLYDGITTKEIYQIAYRILHKLSHRTAGRYRLKKALFQLGPTGFPFEHFIARLFEFEGYEVKTGQLVQGRCVQHEVDVLARKKGKILMAECKFHQTEGAKSDVKTSLYVRSRFHDIREKLMRDEAGGFEFEACLITNTRFTTDATKYGKCSGLQLISWDYPAGQSLRDMIDAAGFHPVTALKTLTNKEKKSLLDKGVVLCREIVLQPGHLDMLTIPQRRLNNIRKEAEALL